MMPGRDLGRDLHDGAANTDLASTMRRIYAVHRLSYAAYVVDLYQLGEFPPSGRSIRPIRVEIVPRGLRPGATLGRGAHGGTPVSGLPSGGFEAAHTVRGDCCPATIRCAPVMGVWLTSLIRSR
jgi:hypothetical protein